METRSGFGLPLLLFLLTAGCASREASAPLQDGRAIEAGPDSGSAVDASKPADAPATVPDSPSVKLDIVPRWEGDLKTACTNLDKLYTATVTLAKKCNPPLPECTLKVKTQLTCPCETFVSTSDKTDVAKLSSLESQWGSLGCTTVGWVCPAIACPNVTSATCSKTVSGGALCVDNY
jgi:hypothetical protein